MSLQDVTSYDNIRIYDECEGKIENPSPGSPFGIAMLAGDPEGQIFLSYPHTNNGFFFLLATVFIYLFIYLFILK